MFGNIKSILKTCVALSLLLLQLFPLYEGAPFKFIKHSSLSKKPHTSILIGCIIKKSLCQLNEFCADDNLLGRCLPLNQNFEQNHELNQDLIQEEQSDNNEKLMNDETFKLLKHELLRISELGASWSNLYINCLLNYILKYGTLSQNICLQHLQFPKNSDNRNNIPNRDDPLRKYRNEPQILPKLSASHLDSSSLDDLSSLPIFLIHNKNIPQHQPEVRVLRSADYFHNNNYDDDNIEDSKKQYNDHEIDEREVNRNNEDLDLSYILVDDSDNKDYKNEEIDTSERKKPILILDNTNSEPDYDSINAEWLKEIDEIVQNTVDKEGSILSNRNEDDPLFIIDIPHHSSEPIYGMIRDKNQPEIENDNNQKVSERDEDLDDSEVPLQQEAIYGTINYNNANDDQARKLSNFYRMHRYDIKKPGPKYLENYFFEDFLPKLQKPEMKHFKAKVELNDENSDHYDSVLPESMMNDAKMQSSINYEEKKDEDEDEDEDENKNENEYENENGNEIENKNEKENINKNENKNENENENENEESQIRIKTKIQPNVGLKNTLNVFEKTFLNDNQPAFQKKIITEDPESEQTIRSSLPLSEGPVKVDGKLRNTLIISKANQDEKTNLEAIDSTHTYVIMDRQISTDGSKMFIKTLEQVFRLPRGTFSNLRLEKQQIIFKVNPNYRDLNASQVAGKIEENAKLLQDITGFWIQESGIGNRVKLPIISELLIKRQNRQLINYTLLICSGIFASLAITFVILVFRKNLKFREKIKSMMKGTDDLMKSKYADKIRQHILRDKRTKRDKNENNRKNRTNGTNNRTFSEGEKQTISPSSRSSTSSWSEEPVTSNMDIATGHLVLTYMEDHLKKKDRLEKEWEALCAYEVELCSTNAASQAQNANKNRSPDVLPYDHSRVILNDLVNASKSDFINANSITDSDPRNPAYIATQGPLTGTRSDFWQMVWEQGSVCIVMLTRLRESGLSLCDRYWPEEGAETYHDYELHLVSEHIWCDDFLVRSFYLKNLKTLETRTVTQFHFLSWPENGLPPSTKALLDFRRKINKSYKGKSCPIIVHCSDGIGRTGTYILIDMVLNRLSKGAKEIDIAASLEHLRDQRIGLVKSKQQFEFVLLAVADEVQAILKSLAQN